MRFILDHAGVSLRDPNDRRLEPPAKPDCSEHRQSHQNMDRFYRLITFVVLALATTALSAQELRSRDDGDDPRPEEGNISGNHIDLLTEIIHPLETGTEVNVGDDATETEAVPENAFETARGINLPDLDIRTYPNPATDWLNVDFGESLHAQVSLVSLLGQRVHQVEVEAQQVRIHVADMKPGIYFLNIVSGDQRLVRKVKLMP